MQDNKSDTSKKSKKEFVNLLLDRPLTEEERENWTSKLIEQTEESHSMNKTSVVVFRLSQDWFALPTVLFKEVIHHRSIHRLPHHIGKALLGLINLEGELRLCVSLHYIFGLQGELNLLKGKSYRHERMMLIAKEHERWVFPVDEIEGIDSWDLTTIKELPLTLSKSSSNYLKGVMDKGDKSVGLIDEELLFYILRRSIE